MAISDLQQAEQASRTRSSLMAAMAVILVIHAFIGFGDEASSMTPWLRHGIWALMILLWLAVLATGGWLRLSRSARRVMNDEVSRANRSRALQTGFWVAMALGLALYFASLQWEFSLREGLRVLTDFAIAAALGRYAWLELR
ncbi:MAG: hypothetical protein ACXWUP_04115 [Allosphingosinicella sp.]